MKSLLVQLPDPTYRAITRVAPKRKRAEFIRAAIRTALYAAEEERMRIAYLKQPHTESWADDWANCEERKP